MSIANRVDHREASISPSASLLAPRQAPNYDPSMPCFDRDGVAALAQSFGVLSITHNSVKRATLAGELKAHRVSNRLRWSENDVRAWLLGMTR